MREALVRQLMPQKSWPTAAMMQDDLRPAVVAHRALEDRDRGAAALGHGLRVGGGERDRQQDDAADDRRVEDRRQTPWAADFAAPCVSSEMCARGVVARDRVLREQEARAAARTTRTSPLPKPELLRRSVKTKSALACLSGTMIRIATITATPSTCHHTEMPLRRATRWLPAMFTITCSARMIAKSRNVSRSSVRRRRRSSARGGSTS